MQRPAPKLAEGKSIPEEIRKQVIGDVKQTIASWDETRSADLCRNTFGLQLSHRVMAAIMDSLFKRYCKVRPGAEKTLLDEDLKSVFATVIDALIARTDDEQQREQLRKMKACPFEPRVRDTFGVLQEHFDDVPPLRSFVPQERWRLLVDPLKIDMLGRHGIDTNNPLLAFIFDTDKSYAHELACDWVNAMTLAQEPFSLDTVLNLIEMSATAGFSTRNPSFKAYGSTAGIARIAQFMGLLEKEFKVHTAITFSDMRFEQLSGAIRRVRCNDFQPWVPLAGTPREPMQALLAQRDGNGSEREKFEFQRRKVSEDDLKKVYRHIVTQFNQRALDCTSSDDKLLAVADTYLQGETLHALSDKNFRIWGLLIPNMLLTMLGEPMSVLYDPNASDGSSTEEVAQMLRRGQEWCNRYISAEP